MSDHSKDSRKRTEIPAEIERLQFRLQEAEETLQAIRSADVDALVVAGPRGEQVFSITGAEHIYRVIVETMNEAALTVDPDGTILFCNRRFCDLMRTSIQEVMGRKVTTFAARPQQLSLRRILAEARKNPTQQHLLLRAADGTSVPVQLAASALEVGGSTSICLVATDLTELEASAKSIRVLREHQQALEESEARFRTMFEASQDAIVITDDAGVCIQANPAVRAIFGLPPEQVLGRKLSQFLDDGLDFPTFWQAFLAAGSFRGELGLIDARRQRREVDLYAVTNILPGRHMSVIHDITERKEAQRALEEMNERLQMQAEELAGQSEELRAQTEELRVQTDEVEAANAALRQSEERYRRFFKEDLTGDFLATPEGKILECNPAFAEIYGFADLKHALGCDIAQFNPTDWAELMARLRAECRVQGYQCMHRRPDGREIHVVANVVGQFDEAAELTKVQGYLYDDTERKQAEEALRRSEEKFAKAFRSSPIAVVVTRRSDGRILETNEATPRLLHFGRDELIGHTTLDLGIWADVQDRVRFIQQISAAGSVRDLEYRLYTKDRTLVTIRLSAELLEFSGETCLLSTLVDVTEQKRAEETRRESEERLKRTQEIAHLGSWELDLVNDRLSWSDEVYRIFGLAPQEFQATYEAFLETVHPDDRAAVDAAYSGSLREGRPTYEIEHRIVRKSTGEIRTVHEKCEHVRDASGRIVRSVGMVHDITERKRAEEALQELNATLENKVAQRTAELQHRARQLQKLTLELSETEDRERRQLAEILHDDLQQQLAAAKFHLSLLNNRAKYDPAQQTIVAQVDQILMEAIQKSRNLSHELSPGVLYHGDFASALGWLADQVQAKHGLEVKVDAFGEINVESDALKSFLYKAAQEMLFNVVKHARIDKARVRVRRFGRCVCLSVSDRGRGFDPQEIRQTTGFGLLSIRERVELLGGRMKMHSVKGQGSTFHVVVPDGPLVQDGYASLEGPGRTREGLRVPGAAAATPKVRVLLADDHEIVREGLISLLSEVHDIEVVGEAANGREAINQAYRLQPDVVVMDVAMPLINGDDATRQIKLHLPKTRIIALSMYEEPDMVEKMRQAGAEAYLLKTAPSEELIAAIRGRAHAAVTT